MSKHPFSVGIATLGCKVNQYESEAIAEAFAQRGALLLSPMEVCDVYVINTCTVTEESDRKVRQTVRRLIRRKGLETESGRAAIDHYRSRILSLAERIDTLIW